jgi:hypothetical protein
MDMERDKIVGERKEGDGWTFSFFPICVQIECVHIHIEKSIISNEEETMVWITVLEQ